jgi:hypothetical protein
MENFIITVTCMKCRFEFLLDRNSYYITIESRDCCSDVAVVNIECPTCHNDEELK